MKHRLLGADGPKVSEVGMGCWQLGGDFGPMEEARALDIVEGALEAGITFFDTADIYGGGKSEERLGQALARAPSAPAVVATKYGRGEAYPDKYSFTDMADGVKRSQDRLQRDRIDLLQLHCLPQNVMERGEVFDWLRRLQQDKLIGQFGASVETIEEGLICLQQEGIASIQVIFNIFRQRLLDELLPTAIERNVGIVVRLPLASGMLSGKFTEKTQFSETDHRHYNRDGQAFSVGETFAGIPYETGLQLVRQLQEYVPEGYSMAQMAMRWLLDHPAVSTIIAGASSIDQARENASASDLEPLGAELHDRLRHFYKQEVEQHIRGVY